MQKKFDRMFVSFEGGEGSGKTTQASLLHNYLFGRKINSVLTREPGGSNLGEELRILLKKQHDATAELLLLLASRHDHVKNLIIPSLEANKWVICDRFIDSTLCYQGLMKGLGIDYIKNLHNQIIGKIWPDFTFVLDLPTREIQNRLSQRTKLSHYDLMTIDQHEVIREGFLSIARSFPERIYVLDATKNQEVLQQEILTILGLG